MNVAGTNYPGVIVTRRHRAIDVTWTAFEAPSLPAWTPTAVLANTVNLGNGLEQATYRSATAVNGQPRFFQIFGQPMIWLEGFPVNRF